LTLVTAPAFRYGPPPLSGGGPGPFRTTGTVYMGKYEVRTVTNDVDQSRLWTYVYRAPSA